MEVGGVASLPGTTTKPTIIRPQTSQGSERATAVPARPAPPAPGIKHNGQGERPPPPKIPSRPESEKTTGVPEKPQRPMSVNTTNVPAKPQRPGSMKQLPTKQTAGSTPGKKQLEITIVSAQPMSEVGFRELKGSKSPNTDRKISSDAQNVPQIPPRKDLPEPLIPVPSSNTTLPSVPPRKDVPGNLPLPPVPPRKDLPDPFIPTNSINSSNKSEKSRPPLPVTRPAASPTFSKPGLDKNDRVLPDERPVPKPRVLPSKNSTEELASQKISEQNKDSVENVDIHMKSDDNCDTPVASSGPPKPKRPTIIRVDKSQKSFKSSSQTDSSETDGDNSSSLNNKTTTEKETKSQVTVETDKNSNNKATKPPPLAPKPKPTLLAKPKPELHSKTVEQSASDWASKVDSFNSLGENKKPNIIRPPPKPKRMIVGGETGSTDKGGNLEDSKAQSDKGDNCDIRNDITVVEGYVYAQINKVRKPAKEVPKDDMNIDFDSQPPPPVPKKRPSSICNIPQALKEEELHSARNLESSGVEKHSNPELNTRKESPNSIRKPVPRMRPISFAARSHFEEQTDRSQPPPIIGRPPPPRKYSPSGVDKTTHEDTELKQDDMSPSVNSKVQKPPPPRPSKSPPSADKTDVMGTSKPPPPRPSKSPQSTESDIKDDVSIQQKLGPLPSIPDVTAQRSDTESSKSTSGKPVTEPSKSPPGRPDTEPTRSPPVRPNTEPTRPPPVRPTASPSQGPAIEKSEKPPKPQSPRLGKLSKPPSPKTVTSDLPPLPSRPGPSHPLYHYMINVAHCVAEFDYQARELDEISFQAGTCIVLLKRIDGFWLLGKIGDKEGMFPEEFVQIIVPLAEDLIDIQDGHVSSEIEGIPVGDSDSVEKPDLIGHGPRCRARFDYEGEGQEDLNFEEGDYIQLLERVGDEWMKGKFSGKVGIFPLSFVEIIEDLPLDDNQGSTITADNNIATALYDFQSDVSTDLSFQEGDKIVILSRVNGEWLYGQANGHTGQFPQSFIDEVPNNLPAFTPAGADVEQNEPQTPELGTCTALYDFEGSSPDDLVFSEGQIITVISHVDSDWLRGRIGEREGIFPISFVQIND